MFQINLSKMPGQQLTPEQRSHLALEYHKMRGQYNCINVVKYSFSQEFPGVQLPSKNTIKRIWRKQKTHFIVHNLNSKNSPGLSHSGRKRSARTPENIQAVKDILDTDAAKPADADSINSARKNELGLSASTWCRIAKHDLKYHSYKLVVSQKLKPQDLPRLLLLLTTFWTTPLQQILFTQHSVMRLLLALMEK